MNTLSIGFTNEPYIYIDPRTKFMVFLIANIIAFSFPAFIVELSFHMVILLLLINGKMFKHAIVAALLNLFARLINGLLLHYVGGIIATILIIISRTIIIFVPVAVLAMFLFTTTTASDFIAAFKKIKMPQKLVITFTVMFRFFPTILEEWRNIQNAMKFRGVSLSLKNWFCKPMTTLEYTLVPLLMSSVNIANDLTAASLSRGLDENVERTCIKTIKFRLIDYTLALVSLIYLVYAIINIVRYNG